MIVIGKIRAQLNGDCKHSNCQNAVLPQIFPRVGGKPLHSQSYPHAHNLIGLHPETDLNPKHKGGQGQICESSENHHVEEKCGCQQSCSSIIAHHTANCPQKSKDDANNL